MTAPDAGRREARYYVAPDPSDGVQWYTVHDRQDKRTDTAEYAGLLDECQAIARALNDLRSPTPPPRAEGQGT